MESAYDARKKALAESTGVSEKVGNLTGQGINIGAKKLRNAAIEMAKRNTVDDNYLDINSRK